MAAARRLPRGQRQHARRRGVARRGGRPPARRPRGRLRTCARQALRTTERVVHGWARERDWRLPEHFTAEWEPLPDFNRDRPADPFRPYGVTVGHQFEWARLCLHLRAVARRAARLAARRRRRPLRCRRGARLGGRRAPPASRTRSTGTTAPSSARGCTGCSARPSRRRACWPRPRGTQRFRDGGAAVAGARRAGLRRPLDRQLAPRADADRRGRHERLGRAARRLPPGPDAAARRPAGARQPRRRAPVTSTSLGDTRWQLSRRGSTPPAPHGWCHRTPAAPSPGRRPGRRTSAPRPRAPAGSSPA